MSDSWHPTGSRRPTPTWLIVTLAVIVLALIGNQLDGGPDTSTSTEPTTTVATFADEHWAACQAGTGASTGSTPRSTGTTATAERSVTTKIGRGLAKGLLKAGAIRVERP